MANSEKPSAKTASDSPFPDDVLVIRYKDLSPDPLVRLDVVAAIGRLLDTSSNSQLPSDLVSSPASAQALYAWLDREEARHFWRVDGKTVVVHRICEKHVLVGTRYLLQDLNTRTTMPHSPQLAELDLVWRAAARLGEQIHTM